MMRRAADSNSLVGNYTGLLLYGEREAVTWIAAQIHSVLAIGNVEGLCEFAGTRAEIAHIVYSTPALH